jgi:3-carboxy-cis,cis-muconate cycloisomerase
MPVRLIESLATTEALAGLFSDESVLQAMLDFEVQLGRAQALLNIIPQAAADAIAAAADPRAFDTTALAKATLRAGTLGIPVVKALTEAVRKRDPVAAGFVHWGATSQDVADTAMMLLLKRAQPVLDSDLRRLQSALRQLSAKYQGTTMLGRTLMQAAPPVTMGLKSAGWFGAIQRSRNRVRAAFANTLIVQFGGATGTAAALGNQGIAVGKALAERLGLEFPDAPWHTHRDRLACLVCECGVLVGSLGKMARDITLLMQNEVGEVAEPSGEGRGGSSTMPHKRNPVGCTATLAAASRVPGLVAAFLSAMVQEHERAVGGWQAEWPIVSSVIQATGVALASMAEVAEGLTVDAARMRVNIDDTLGTIFAERAMMLLGQNLGRDVAQRVLEEATRKSAAEKRRLGEVLAEMPEVSKHLDHQILSQLDIPEQYLGVSDQFRRRLLASTEQQQNGEDEKE